MLIFQFDFSELFWCYRHVGIKGSGASNPTIGRVGGPFWLNKIRLAIFSDLNAESAPFPTMVKYKRSNFFKPLPSPLCLHKFTTPSYSINNVICVWLLIKC